VFPKKAQLSKERENCSIRSQQDPVTQPKDKALETTHTVTASQSEYADELRAHTHTLATHPKQAHTKPVSPWPSSSRYGFLSLNPNVVSIDRGSQRCCSLLHTVHGEHMELRQGHKSSNRGHPLPSFDQKTHRP
jgi:hypothetical protein